MPIINDNSFAAACYNSNTVQELRQALAGAPDATDMRDWNLTAEEWRSEIQLALNAKTADAVKQTVMTTNNGYDAILLVDKDDRVLSAWAATLETVKSYLADTDANDWEPGTFDGFDGEQTTISDYGTEVGRDGSITDERRAFYGLEFHNA